MDTTNQQRAEMAVSDTWATLLRLTTEVSRIRAETIQRDTRFEVVGLDSVGVMEIVAMAEDHLHISVPDEAMHGVTTFGALADVLVSCLADRNHSAP